MPWPRGAMVVRVGELAEWQGGGRGRRWGSRQETTLVVLCCGGGWSEVGSRERDEGNGQDAALEEGRREAAHGRNEREIERRRGFERGGTLAAQGETRE